MRVNEVPQEINPILEGGSKAVFARDENGRMVTVPCPGWEVEAIVTQHAVDVLKQQARAALVEARAGTTSPLTYWMYEKRMDETVLAQSTGFWRWRVRRHLQPQHFAKLPAHILKIYADALGLQIDTLKSLP
jgi:hypothetical protein